jgi:hypothetical protein
MPFTLRITTESDAFLADLGLELAWVLGRLTETIMRENREGSSPFSYPLRDVRGNLVGEAKWRPPKRSAARRTPLSARPRTARKPGSRKAKAPRKR